VEGDGRPSTKRAADGSIPTGIGTNGLPSIVPLMVLPSSVQASATLTPVTSGPYSRCTRRRPSFVEVDSHCMNMEPWYWTSILLVTAPSAISLTTYATLARFDLAVTW
jgi:hypothetical protein